MKKLMKMSLAIALTLSFATVANAEVFAGGISFSEPTPPNPTNARSNSNSNIAVIPVPVKAKDEEKKGFDNVSFLTDFLKPRVIVLQKKYYSLKDCEKGFVEFSKFQKNRYAKNGYKEAPAPNGSFASTFEPDFVVFARFNDEGKQYNLTTGCKRIDDGTFYMYGQTDNLRS